MSALKIKWSSPNLQQNGRRGQVQAGVDIFGLDELGRFVGIQCKNSKDPLRIREITEEIEKAESFVPRIETLYVATTQARDARLQKTVRLLSDERAARGAFRVGLLFWDDLIDDLTKDLAVFSKHYPELAGRLEAEIAKQSDVPAEETFEVGVDEIYEPSLWVLRERETNEHPHGLAAHSCFNLRIFSAGLEHRPPFGPRERRAFLERVKKSFWEDQSAELESAFREGVIVQHRGPDLSFHRRWAWWRQPGVMGCAATLAGRVPGVYSVADMVVDMVRLLQMAANSEAVTNCLVVVHIDPDRPRPIWKLSHGRIDGGDAFLAGVEEPGAPSTARRTATRWGYETHLAGLGDRAAEIVGRIVVEATSKMHRSNVDLEALLASILRLLETHRKLPCPAPG